ncbi:MAG: hypothetical protein IME92_03390, partial [Proteobacteria bacterium]|nr:hypothetical protein [Pseudomonadota bacterium]
MKFTTKTLLSATTLLAASAGMSHAAGLDRATFSAAILYQEGTYVEIAGGLTLPDVRSTVLNADSVADNFNTLKLGFKMDVTEKIAVALTYTNQAFGADIDYSPQGIALTGAVNGQRLDLMGKYRFTESISAYAGIRYQYINGEVDLTGAGGFNLQMDGDDDYGFIAGVAYEIPEIKLR